MVSELILSKGMMKISTTSENFLKKCSIVAIHLKNGIKAL